MARSQRLRLSEVRSVFHLVQECRDLGADWEVWSHHLMTGVLRLTDAQVGAFGGSRVVDGGRLTPLGPVLMCGWTDAAVDALAQEYVRVRAALDNPCLRSFAALGLPNATRSRKQLVDDRTWYRSQHYDEWIEPMGMDASLISQHTPPGQDVSVMLSLHRPVGAEQFERRQARLVSLVQEEIVPLIGTALAAPGEPRLLALPPRLRQTLLCLLEGDGEKQAAARLGLSQATVHQYVGRLYTHFGVNDRAELLSLFLRRSGLLTLLRALLASGPPGRAADPG